MIEEPHERQGIDLVYFNLTWQAIHRVVTTPTPSSIKCHGLTGKMEIGATSTFTLQPLSKAGELLPWNFGQYEIRIVEGKKDGITFKYV